MTDLGLNPENLTQESVPLITKVIEVTVGWIYDPRKICRVTIEAASERIRGSPISPIFQRGEGKKTMQKRLKKKKVKREGKIVLP